MNTQPLLFGREVFLSASLPVNDPKKLPKYVNETPPDVAFEINESVAALTVAILAAGGRLVFGGHPTITPLVAHTVGDFFDKDLDLIDSSKAVALSPATTPPVVLYHSTFFRRHYIKEKSWLEESGIAEFNETALVVNDQAIADPSNDVLALYEANRTVYDKSMDRMRSQMIKRSNLAAMVVIGGMNGVEEEAKLFAKVHPRAPIYAIVSTGGASRFLVWEQKVGVIAVDEPFLQQNLPAGVEIPPMWLKSTLDGSAPLPLTPYGLVMRAVVNHLSLHNTG